MKNALLIFSLFLLLTCSSDLPKQSNISSENENGICGVYRISSGGGYSVVLSIKDSINIDYLTWVDVGGHYLGRKGEYKIKQDTLFLRLFHPINIDSHYVRTDTLVIKNWNGVRIFRPIFVADWFVDIDNKTNQVISGSDCFAKVANVTENYYPSLEISDWDTLIGKNSMPIPFPALPPRPRQDSCN
jgi:hypothetical protein